MDQTYAEQQPPQNRAQQTGIESQSTPQPIEDQPQYRGADKLKGRVALITGGDSGIGRAVAIFFAKEGADVVIMYLAEYHDAQQKKNWLKSLDVTV